MSSRLGAEKPWNIRKQNPFVEIHHTPLSQSWQDQEGWGNGAERPRLVQTQCWCPQGRWLLSPSGVYAANLFSSFPEFRAAF